MLDRTSKKFLDWLSKQTDKSVSYFDEVEYPDMIGTSADFFALVRFLESEGYVEVITSKGTDIQLGVRLSHKGSHWREFRRQERIKYFEDNWIDFCAFVLSGIALAISIFSRT